MTMKEFKPLVAELIDAGWKMETHDPETFRKEDEACAKAVCDKCGKPGLCYMPFIGPARPKPTATLSNFRAFSVCHGCHNVNEF